MPDKCFYGNDDLFDEPGICPTLGIECALSETCCGDSTICPYGYFDHQRVDDTCKQDELCCFCTKEC